MNSLVYQPAQIVPALPSSEGYKALIEKFTKSQNASITSRELYGRVLRAFFSWIDRTHRTLNTLTDEDLIAYKDDLLAQDRRASTVASYINTLRRFYSWTAKKWIYPDIAADVHPPKEKKQFFKQPLAMDQTAKLLRYERAQNPRDFAIVNLMVRTGLRCIEVVRANVEDITFRDGARVLKVQGKGCDDKDNFVQLCDAVYGPIAAYLSTRKKRGNHDPLFACESRNNKGGRLTTHSISAMVKAGLRAVDIDCPDITAHSLRHTAGTMALENGCSLSDVKDMLRHADEHTTERYIHTVKDKYRIRNGAELVLDRVFNDLLNNNIYTDNKSNTFNNE